PAVKYGINTLDDLDVRGKVVLCRVDINSPIDPVTGALRDTTRLRGCAPTLRELAESGARLVLLAHQGGDLEYHNYASTEPHAAVLSELIGRPVRFVDDVCGPAARAAINALAPGEVLLLDNVRFMAEELTLFETKLALSPEQQAKTLVVRKLTPLAELYVCDAFAAAHRSQPTLVGFERLLPSAMGRLFEKEYENLARLREEPARPCVFVLGGTKIQEAFPMLAAALRDGVVDTVLTAGLVANVMLAAKGVDLGAPSREFIRTSQLERFVAVSQAILAEYGDRIVLPDDLAYVGDGARVEVRTVDLPVDELLVDIGHETATAYAEVIAAAGTVFVNGPAGIFEKPETEYGTRALWEAMASTPGFSALGGGDSVTAMNAFGLAGRFDYVCTAGGAMVQFLSGAPMPVVEALKDSAARFG
ncbi:MAG TPA: phosphoglycerate kinase, partial [Thermoleophilia bacterium]|nr:phosphoglycerate kinase [Thermoleophilia bacterium]